MSEYVKPKVWIWENENTDRAGNRPTAGARFEQKLPRGDAPLQVYSLGTPNGIKVTIMLEELVELGVTGASYDLYKINIGQGEQFGSDFVKMNPNSKIPVMVDYSEPDPVRVFESGSILVYLAEKFGKLIPFDRKNRTECMNWVFWQMGSAPFVGGGFGHFYHYAPTEQEYPINRFAMETKRQLDVLDQHLENNQYMVCDEYTIADIMIWSWYGRLASNKLYQGSYEFLNIPAYKNLIKWTERIADRPAVKRALAVDYQSIN